jgi:hypothetical protein
VTSIVGHAPSGIDPEISRDAVVVHKNVPIYIVEMANENPTWGEERIDAELLLKLGIRVLPRAV